MAAVTATRVDYPHRYPYVFAGGRWRPLLPVVLGWQGRTVSTLALLDSGADRCVFSGALAEQLEIDLTAAPRQRSRGIGGALEVSHHPIDVRLGGVAFRVTAAFHSQTGMRNLLGRDGFFPRVQIGIRESSREILLRLEP